MILVAVKILASYLLGSLSGSLLLGRLRGVDIRTQGSGNAGGTNALRTQGFWFALGVIVIDIGKGAVAAGLVAVWQHSGASVVTLPWMMAACGLAAVLGHIWPAYFSFRGGKGAGTVVGVLAVIAPLVMAGMIGVWLAVLVLSGYVGLATILAGLMIAPLALLLGNAPPALLAFGVVTGVLMVITHRSNIQRLLHGAENRFERVRVVNWWR